ncbi:c-type cytochrome [Sphingobacterium sp. SGG-5]|uniref:c-type cytochrome n=1 Tax=Sphingobacterium sp. SGG-5 TaxID=2710881 RepID=UPI001F1042A2|nr:cytochrome c [Sphingobacterium sp. SGG-5]
MSAYSLKPKAYSLFAIALLIGAMSYLSACQSNVDIQMAQYAVNGQKVYRNHCQNCHGAKGEGLAKLYPPLTDNNFFALHREKLSCIVRHGLHEKIEVSGQQYDQPMPGNNKLTDLDIAYVLTYVTTTFGQSDSIYSHEAVKKALSHCK